MKRLLTGLFALAIAATTAFAQTTDYPNKPIRMVVPYSSGGGLDSVTRLVAQAMSESLGQPIVIDNRAGAGGMIGAEAVATANPDGYTLLMAGNPEMVINPTLLAPVRYDVVHDFIPIMLVSESANILVANPSVKGSLAELLAKPGSDGQLSIGSPGLGSAQHLAIEVIRASSKADIVHVPYKGAAPAVAAVLGGQVKLALVGAPPVLPQIRAGKLRALAVTQATRSKLAPEIPTMEEATGIKGLDFYKTWYGLLAPAGTPQPVVDKIQHVIAAVLARPDIRAKLAKLGTEVVAIPGAAFAAQIRSETERYAEGVKRFNIKVN